MVDGIPEEWSTAEYHAIFHPDGSTYEAEYVRQVDDLPRGFQPAGNSSKIIRELRQRFREAGQPLWGRVWFTLRPDGTFNVRWGYEDCDANGNAIFDEETEVQRHNARHARLTRVQPPQPES